MSDEYIKMTPGRIIQSIVSIILFPTIFLLIAGDWLWVEGWIFCLWFLVMTISITVYLYYKDPALLAERARPKPGEQKGWDKIIISIIMLGNLLWLIIMPLDARRFHWSPEFPLWLEITGGVGLIIALYFLFRSVADNPFASSVVKIQAERKQHVVSTGVYGFVRHPMYLGATLMAAGSDLLLGSIYGLVITLILTIVLIVRILGEEKMLVEELEGYEDYKKKVRYRLVPFIW